MVLKGNSRVTALNGGICTLRKKSQDYEETQATIIFRDGIIIEVLKLNTDTSIDDHIKELKSRYDNLLTIRLDNPDNPCHIFPGLIDIQNHIDYNMMPIWERPVEQPWDNRHEWRNCTEYSDDIKKLFSYIFILITGVNIPVLVKMRIHIRSFNFSRNYRRLPGALLPYRNLQK